jgi:UDP-N-acetylmuramoyl-L-alanyl-D-glutamate--2,6-diaminopimelate ligase
MAQRARHPAPILSDLLQGLAEVAPGMDRSLTGISADSRSVGPGDLFLARPGARVDARVYIDDALARGAAAVVYEDARHTLGLRAGAPCVGLPDLTQHLGPIASRFYGEPSRHMWVAGVTGTNGKTTVTHLIAGALDPPVGLLGTLGYGVSGRLRPGAHTTPDAVSLQRLLSELFAGGVRRTVMEVSSHALHQGRVAGVHFDLAVLTNLSRDHLDYHGDMAAYGEAKSRLFRYPGLGAAVINGDDELGLALLADPAPGVDTLVYSLDSTRTDAHLVARCVEASAAGLRLLLRTPRGDGELRSPLLGRFNAANLLAALGALLTLDLPLADALTRLGRVPAVPGRMERFGGEDGRPLVVVDYAHTTDALTQVLETLRAHCGARLWCVFGCGGDRDRGKRPEMGAAAERLADRLVLTDDNPRGEDGDAIVAQILAGLAHPRLAQVERDRPRAIGLALAAAGPGDVVLVAGKGHEDYQEVAGVRHPYSDRDTVLACLQGEPGPQRSPLPPPGEG